MAWDPSRFGKWAHKALQVEASTVERARKVLALQERGATDGEKAAAADRLAAIASKAGISVDLLTQALR